MATFSCQTGKENVWLSKSLYWGIGKGKEYKWSTNNSGHSPHSATKGCGCLCRHPAIWLLLSSAVILKNAVCIGITWRVDWNPDVEDPPPESPLSYLRTLSLLVLGNSKQHWPRIIAGTIYLIVSQGMSKHKEWSILLLLLLYCIIFIII